MLFTPIYQFIFKMKLPTLPNFPNTEVIYSTILLHCYQSECDRRVWFTAAGSPELLLEPTSGHPDGDSQGERDPNSGKEYWHKVRVVTFTG